MSNYKVLAVEPQLDGTEDILTPDDTRAMRLPFDYGWDHWGIFQDCEKIARFDDFALASQTCSALNNMVLLDAAA
jgi:hypothetical protein